jgi:translation elongation factor P/translation initiation factor 5A
MIFKVVFDKKIHLLKLSQQASIEDLKRAVAQAYQLQPEAFTLYYIDEEGDDITLNDEHDYAIMTSSELKTMKIKV